MISKRKIKKISLVLLILLFVAIFFLLNLNFIFSEFFTSNLSSVASNQIPKKYANEILENSKLNQSLINENEE